MINTFLAALLIMTASWERRGDALRIMADGHQFNPKAMTCATWRFPLGTKLHIVEAHNHSTCDVVVTDRPARRYSNRVDLSPAAFKKLDGLELGLCDVQVTPE